MHLLILAAFLFFAAFAGRFLLFVLIAVAVLAAIAAVYAYRKHVTYKAAVTAVLTDAYQKGKALDAALVAKVKTL